MIEHSERKIYLIWQEADHGSRHVIGELTEKASGHYVFRYLQGPDMSEAKKRGFAGYPSFPDLNQAYNENVIESFSMRLPSRSRDDFKVFLKYWEIENPSISDFDLLSITGAKLHTDHFEFIDPHTEKRPTDFLTELAGFHYYVKSGDDVQTLKEFREGDAVQLVRDPANIEDTYAVKVMYKNKHVGYLKRVHARTVSEELTVGKQVSSEIKHVDANGIVNSVLLRIKIPA